MEPIPLRQGAFCNVVPRPQVASGAQIKSSELRIRNHPIHLDASKIGITLEVKIERPKFAMGKLFVWSEVVSKSNNNGVER
jgi:hypothetical protein